MQLNFKDSVRIGFANEGAEMFLSGGEGAAPPLDTVPVEGVPSRLAVAIRISL